MLQFLSWFQGKNETRGQIPTLVSSNTKIPLPQGPTFESALLLSLSWLLNHFHSRSVAMRLHYADAHWF